MTEQADNVVTEVAPTADTVTNVEVSTPAEPTPPVPSEETSPGKTDALLVEVLMKTGASKAGATNLIGKATDGEKQTLFACVRSEDNVLEISDSKAWQDAMTGFAQRLADEQKASVEGEGSAADIVE